MPACPPIVSRWLQHHPVSVAGIFVLILIASVLFAVVQAPSAPQQTSIPSITTPDDEPITPIPDPPIVDAAKLALGERLFDDVRLSANGDLACSSCHDLHTNGADGHAGKAQNTASDGGKPNLDILTVFNSALSYRLTWQGSFRSLAAQAEASFSSTSLQTNTAEVVAKLNADPDMVRRFRAAYGQAPNHDNILAVIALFEATLLTPRAPFDRWLEGDDQAMSAKQIEGLRLFVDKGCASCHNGINVGGGMYAPFGVVELPGADLLPPTDKGRFEVTRTVSDEYVFKVPTLRNVDLRPNRQFVKAYGHNAYFKSLKEIVHFYNTRDTGNWPPPETPQNMNTTEVGNLGLTSHEEDLIVSFLKTLSDGWKQ
jgi:cytochrome c peroxidase